MTNKIKLEVALHALSLERAYGDIVVKAFGNYTSPFVGETKTSEELFDSYRQACEGYNLQQKTTDAAFDDGDLSESDYKMKNEVREMHEAHLRALRNGKRRRELVKNRAEAETEVGVARRALKKSQVEYDKLLYRLLKLDDDDGDEG